MDPLDNISEEVLYSICLDILYFIHLESHSTDWVMNITLLVYEFEQNLAEAKLSSKITGIAHLFYFICEHIIGVWAHKGFTICNIIILLYMSSHLVWAHLVHCYEHELEVLSDNNWPISILLSSIHGPQII